MKKIVLLSFFAIVLILSTYASFEIRGGLYVSAAPDTAVDMFGSGVFVGGSIRTEIFPMIKLGISVDRAFMFQSGLKDSDLNDDIIEMYVNDYSDQFDVEYAMMPICLEGMIDLPGIYGVVGIGIYPSWVSIKEVSTDIFTGEDTETEIYSKADTKFGSFFGGGIHFNVDGIELRLGFRYHVLQVNQAVMENNISAFSGEVGMEFKF